MRNRIRVNQPDIGWTNSDNERRLQAEESGGTDFIDKAAATLPFGRLLEPAEIARAVLWVACNDSGMMTGSVVQFDPSVWGGYDGQAPAPAEPLGEQRRAISPIAGTNARLRLTTSRFGFSHAIARGRTIGEAEPWIAERQTLP